jgi:hypothetical protein
MTSTEMQDAIWFSAATAANALILLLFIRSLGRLPQLDFAEAGYKWRAMKGSLLDTVRPFRSRRPIFVSFASDSDSANAEFAVGLLESKGFECTFLHAPDKRLRPPPGIADEAAWISKRLRALISEASCVVSIASTSSFERPFVLDEFVTALRRAEQVFILWLDPKSPPTGVRGIAHKYNRWLPMPQVWEIDFTDDPVRRLDEFLEANPLFGRSVQD